MYSYVKTTNIQTLFLVCFLNVSTQQEIKRLDLYEGDVCRKGNSTSNPDHLCIRAENCDSLAKDIKNKIYPEICSFDGHKPIVCCSPSISNYQLSKYQNTDIIKKKCDEYAEIAKKYAKPSGYGVVGGTEARPREFPHMALLGFGDTVDQYQWGCGGSLINERWILSAAHCKQLKFKNAVRWARLGDLNIAIDTDDARPKDYRIVEHVIHPDYNPPSRYNDIALFRLETDVEFSAYVRPICLNHDLSLEPKYQIASGWGKTATGEASSDHLLKVTLDTIPADQCNNSYFSSADSKLKFGILPESMVCAGSYDGNSDTCGGDSGGPLQIDNYEYDGVNYFYNQVGITSFGAFCGDKDKPGVYTRVAKYIPWIKSIVWP